MVDIEQPGDLPGCLMFEEGAARILDRHLPASEGYHPPSVSYMPFMERSGFDWFFRHGVYLLSKTVKEGTIPMCQFYLFLISV
jgi:hypothetical protein